jgi:hypothetical protein
MAHCEFEEEYHLDCDGTAWAKRPVIVPSGPSIIVEGPDGVGKTTITKCMSIKTHIPAFKCPSEKQIFFTGGKDSLIFDFTLTHFLEQTDYRFISDRSYPSEWVYSKVFNRETSEQRLETIDKRHCVLGTKILYLYSSIQPTELDDIVPSDKYWDVKAAYDQFTDWTKCRIVSYDTAQSLHLTGISRAEYDTQRCMMLLGMIV